MTKWILLLLLLAKSIFCQDLHIYDVNINNFPEISASVYANNGTQYLKQIKENEISITESGEPAKINYINNFSQESPLPITAVIAVGVSGSLQGRHLNFAREGLRLWNRHLGIGSSELGLIKFDSKVHLLNDLSSDRSVISESIDSLSSFYNYNYNAAIFGLPVGALKLIEKASYKKIIVIISDGHSSQPLKGTNDFLNALDTTNTTLYSVHFNVSCPDSLKLIIDSTGGIYFDKIRTIEGVEEAINKIIYHARGLQPGIISWDSWVKCNQATIPCNADIPNLSLNRNFSYNHKPNSHAFLEFDFYSTFFSDVPIGTKKDTTITLTARNIDLNVSNINSSNSQFEIKPNSFNLKKDSSIALTLSYNSVDSNYSYSEFIFINNSPCEFKYSAAAGFSGVKPSESTLKITYPKGGEFFAVGKDTVITWIGVTESDTIWLDYSTDNGKNWSLITKSATGLNYKWENIPNEVSDRCLIRAKQVSNANNLKNTPQIEWSKTYGGYGADTPVKIIKMDDGNYIVFGTGTSGRNFVDVKGFSSFFVMTIDKNGNILWQNNYGSSKIEILNSAIMTSDGCYLLIGSSNFNDLDVKVNHGGQDIWVVKIDAFGNIIWENSYGSESKDTGWDVCETDNGDFIITINAFKAGAIRIDKSGNLLWNKDLSVSKYYNENLVSISKSNDEGYIIAGSIENGGARFFKINDDGDILWDKSPSNIGNITNVKTLQDGSYVISTIVPDKGNAGIHLLSALGSKVWSVNYSEKAIYMLQNNQAGELIFAGRNASKGTAQLPNKGVYDAWIGKINLSGELLWQKSIGGSQLDQANYIIETNDGGYLVSGYTVSIDGDITDKKTGDSDFWLIKLSSEVNTMQEHILESNFSIVKITPMAKDVDLGLGTISKSKDTIIYKVIYDGGNYPFTVNKIEIVGDDVESFIITNIETPFIIDKQQSVDVGFRFIATREGLHQAKIIITTDAGEISLSVSGYGVAPAIELLNERYDFGSVYLGNTSNQFKFPLFRNIGKTVLEVKEELIRIISDDTNIFFYDFDNLPNSISPGDTFFLNLSFRPDFPKNYYSKLVFKIIDINDEIELDLFGKGVIDGPISATIRVLDASASTKDNVRIYLIAEQEHYFKLSNTNSISLELHYNPTVLLPLDYIPKSVNTVESKITLDSLNSDFSIGDTLATVWFRVALGNSDKSNLRIVDGIANGSDAKVLGLDGVFYVKDICYEGGARLLNTSGKSGINSIVREDDNLAVKINLIEKSPAKLSIYSYDGSLVWQTTITNHVGEHIQNICIRNFANSIYIVNLQTETSIHTEKVILSK